MIYLCIYRTDVCTNYQLSNEYFTHYKCLIKNFLFELNLVVMKGAGGLIKFKENGLLRQLDGKTFPNVIKGLCSPSSNNASYLLDKRLVSY